MIRLQRVREERAVHSGFRGDGRVRKLVRLLDAHLAGDFHPLFQASAWKDTKDQLRVESAGKCAYCEAPTSAVAHGDVEHFRPKSVYWWLTFCYDNYLFACQVCNQVYKSDHFPIHGRALAVDPPLPLPFPAGLTAEQRQAIAARLCPDPLDAPALDRFLAATLSEKSGLVDPYHVDPAPLFKWVPDPVQREVAIAARAPNRVASRRAFEAARDVLGLNRVELRRLRWKTYEILETFQIALNEPALPASLKARTRTQVGAMIAPDAAFAGMCRYFVRDVWNLDLSP